MPIDKNKMLRYTVLDRCLRDLSRCYRTSDLLKAVNDELRKHDFKPVALRTIQLDLQTLQCEPHNAEYDFEMLASHCYRYADTSFHLPLTSLLPAERDALERTISVLQTYAEQTDEQSPQYQWLLIMLQTISGGDELPQVEQYVSFEHNKVFAGNAHFSKLLECILNHRPIVVRYQPYGREVSELKLHPYHLKQYNSRWFLFAKEQGQRGIINLALDRIHSIRLWKHDFEPTDIDFTTYFDNMIGVSRSNDMPIQQIMLRIANSRYPYVETKPFSERQRIVRHDDKYHTITFSMHINDELVAELLSFGADIEVIQPLHLRDKIHDILKQAVDQYSPAQKPCTQ